MWSSSSRSFSWLYLPAVVPLVQGQVIHGQQREVQLRGDLPGALQRQAHPARPLQGLLQHREERQGAHDPTLLQERRAQELPELQEDEGDAVPAEHPGHLQRERHHLRCCHGCVTQSNQTVKLPNTLLHQSKSCILPVPAESVEVHVLGELWPRSILGELPEDVDAALGRGKVHEEVVGQAPRPQHRRVDHVNPDEIGIVFL